MGLRDDAGLYIWEYKPGIGNYYDVRVSTCRAYDGKMENDFSAYVRFCTTALEKLRMLPDPSKNKGDYLEVKVKAHEIKTRFDKERNIRYYNVSIFDFEPRKMRIAGIKKKLNEDGKWVLDENKKKKKKNVIPYDVVMPEMEKEIISKQNEFQEAIDAPFT